MVDITELQHQVAYAMIAMAPEEAESLVFQGTLFPWYADSAFFWLTSAGEKGGFNLEQERDNRNHRTKVIGAMREMRSVEPFSQQGKPFTHYRITLTRDSPNIAIDVEYISEEQSYPGVYMRSVGALTEAEAKALYVPYDEWHIRKQLYDGEVTKAEFDAEMLRRDEAWEAEVKAREM